jgi:glutamate-1-semialdehyde 2,1-aminomutase
MGSLFRIHPVERAFADYRSAMADGAEKKRLDELHRALLDHGVLISPTGLGCLSTAVTEAEIEYFLEIVNHCVRGI